jgi:hypothetical protein
MQHSAPFGFVAFQTRKQTVTPPIQIHLIQQINQQIPSLPIQIGFGIIQHQIAGLRGKIPGATRVLNPILDPTPGGFLVMGF